MNNQGKAIERLFELREAIRLMRDAAGKIELEIIQDFEANDQTAFEDAQFEAQIPLKRVYDVAKFQAVMGEELSPEAFAKVYSPANTKTVEVPATVNGTKAKKLYDQGFAKLLDSTLLPAVRKLVIKRKKSETPI